MGSFFALSAIIVGVVRNSSSSFSETFWFPKLGEQK